MQYASIRSSSLFRAVVHPVWARVSASLGAALLLVPAVAGGVACTAEAPPDPGPPASPPGDVDASDPDRNRPRTDGGFVGPDGRVLRADRFVTEVVSFTPGPCAGFGSEEMPAIVLGPPVGAGAMSGGLDVVSLGIGGEIVLSFEPNAIVDGPGADFIVFENAFFAGGSATQPAADPAEVSVSEDGVTWTAYACEPGEVAPYGRCAGWHPVYSAPTNGVSPMDPGAAGGEAYDLAEIGLATARFVRIRDKASGTCEGRPRPNNSGFDLDAVAIVHAVDP